MGGSTFNQLYPLGLAIGLLLSPEALTLLGNSAGRAGQGVVYLVILAVLIHGLTALAYRRLNRRHPLPEGEMRFINEALGPVMAVWSPGMARVTTAVCVSAALLASAGYAFNEVFVYWFPNLAFSFCLLAALLLINLAGVRVAAAVQLVFVGLALGGLLFLSASGFLGSGQPVSFTPSGSSWGDLGKAALACLLLFVGFDLAAGFPGKDRGTPFKAMIGAILLAGLAFSCWGWVSAEHVAADRLADTSIPHIKVARAVLGDRGWILMGVIVLSGASGAVNALLIAVSRMTAAMARDGLLPSFFALGKKRPVAGILVLGAGIAALMGSGMAGEPVLEVYMKAGLCFWLIHYAVLHGAALVTSVRALTESSSPPAQSTRLLPIAGLMAMTLMLTGIFITEQDWQLLVRIVAALAFLGFALSVFWVLFSRKKGRLHKLHKP